MSQTTRADTPGWPMMLALRHSMAALTLLIAALLPATPAKAESDGEFAYRLCGLFHSPVGYPPATDNASFGAGSGCTWKIGDGDVGATATEMSMMAWRDAGQAGIEKAVRDYDDLFEKKLAMIPGHRTKDLAIACDTSGAPAKMVFWGIPSKSNITGYAVCGSILIYGQIHSPPDSDLDAEAVFVEMMKTAAIATSGALAGLPRPPARKKPVRRP
jgi:hypothetical protein